MLFLMPNYGTAITGTNVYGESELVTAAAAGNVMWMIQVDWDRNLQWGSEIEPQWIKKVSINRGRNERISGSGGQQQPDNEQITVDIYDPDGRYDAFNEDSPLYETLPQPGAMMRLLMVSTTDRTVNECVFVGIYNNAQYDPLAKTATISGVGLSRLFEMGDAAEVYPPCQEFNSSGTAGEDYFILDGGTPVQVNYWKGKPGGLHLDDCVGIVLDLAGSVFEAEFSSVISSDEPDYFYPNGETAWQLLKDLGDAFFARLFFRRDGKIYIVDRAASPSNLSTVSYPTKALTKEGLRRSDPYKSIRNYAKVNVRPHYVPLLSSTSSEPTIEAWSNPGPIAVLPSTTVYVWAKYQENAQKVVQASITSAVTYEAWSSPDKTGIDMSISGTGKASAVDMWDTVGTDAWGNIYRMTGNNQKFCKIKLLNSDTVNTAYFTDFLLKAAGIRETGSPGISIVEDTDSVALNGKNMIEIDSKWIQTAAMAETIGGAYLASLSDRRIAYVSEITYVWSRQELYDNLKVFDVGQVVNFGQPGGTGALLNYGLNGNYMIVGQDVEWLDTSGQNAVARLRFEKFGGLAVALGSTSTGYVANGTTATVSHAVGTGEDRLLLVSIGIRSFFDVSGVTYGGVALTKLDSYALGYPTNGNFAKVEFWYLKNPTSGTANVVVTMPGNEWVEVGVSDFSNVDQVTPFGTVGKAKASNATSCSITVDAAKYDLVADVICTQGGTVAVTVGDDQTLLFGVSSDTNWQASGSTELGTRAGSTVMSWTLASVGYAAMAVAILAKNK